MEITDTEVAVALEQLNKFIIDNELLANAYDQEELINAMGTVAKTFINQTKTPRKVLPERFVKETVSRLHEKAEKIQTRLEKQRMVNQLEEVAELKDRPTINQRSKRMAEGYKPIFMRVSDTLQHKVEVLKSIQEGVEKEQFQKEGKECTFRPNSKKSSTFRANFYEDCVEWQKNRTEHISEFAQKVQEQEAKALKFRPFVSKTSRRLAERQGKRSTTPLFDRLSTPKGMAEGTSTRPTTPTVSQNSRKLTESRDGNVHERLYLRKGRNMKIRGVKPVRRKIDITEIPLTPSVEFLLHPLQDSYK